MSQETTCPDCGDPSPNRPGELCEDCEEILIEEEALQREQE